MHFFNSWVIFHCVYVPQLPYPFICQWTSMLLPCPSYCKQLSPLSIYTCAYLINIHLLHLAVISMEQEICLSYHCVPSTEHSRSSISICWIYEYSPGSSVSKQSAYYVGGPGSVLGSGRSSGEGNGNPLQNSCLENPTDRGAWWATVHGVTKSRTQLCD